MSHHAEAFRRHLAGVDNRCTCLSAVDAARSAIEGREPALCAIHQPHEVEQRRIEDEVAEIEARAKPLSEALGNTVQSDRLRAVADLCTCRPMSTKDLLGRTLQGLPAPEPCTIHDTQPAGSSMSLNGGDIESFVRRKLGISPSTPTTSPSDFDDAA